MNLLHAILLAIIEGITEFLPISSTGHMIIGSTVLGIASDPFVKMFTVAIQFGAILSVVVLYWKRFFQGIGLYKRLFIAFLPAALLGLLLKSHIDLLLENVLVVAVALIVGGIVFLWLDEYLRNSNAHETTLEDITPLRAFRVGLFQVVSMIPGVSRSAATIIGGISQGLKPATAAEFSFLLAVPTMFAATCKSMVDFFTEEGGSFHQDQLVLLLVGNLVAFIVAMMAIRSFIGYLNQHGFKVFGYYRIVVGTILLLCWALGFFEGVTVGNF